MEALPSLTPPAPLVYALSLYTLSFLHYGLYFVAYRYGRLEPVAFRRWAVALKTLALVMLALAYLPYALPQALPQATPSAATPLWAALAVPVLMALGFGLNAWAARVLGVERTYYGHELMNLPYQHVTAFPYSVTAHPMLYGNLLAFAAPLLNPGFRADWWPLALGHVMANLGLLALERWVTPLRLGSRSGSSPGSSPVSPPGRLPAAQHPPARSST